MLLENFIENLTEHSHKRVKVKCDINISGKCKKEYTLEYRNYLKFKYDDDKLNCIFCANKLKNGKNNPNTKYFNIDDNMFNKINSIEKAYLLGWIASDGCIQKKGFSIQIKDYDRDVLEKINKILFNNEFLIKTTHKNMVTLTVISQQIAIDLIKTFKIENKVVNNSYKKSYIIEFPDIEDKFVPYFVRGVFEGNGYYRYTKINPTCGITFSSRIFLEKLIKKMELVTNITYDMFELTGNKSLDFLYKIYKNVQENNEILFMNRKYTFYKKICGWIPHSSKTCLYFKYTKLDKNAKPPSKKQGSDSGYDLHLLKKIKTNGNVEFYDTGIAIEPTFGYYFDLVGRSSISKSGYMLANNVGIIDRTYTGSIIVPLIKLDKNKPDLELPCRLVQIIPRQIHHLDIIEVNNINETERGFGGFGSTG